MLRYLINKTKAMLMMVIPAVILICSSMVYANDATGVRTRQISMLAFDKAVLLDVVGPLTVFSAANFILSMENGKDIKAYRIEILAEQVGLVNSHSGMRFAADNSFLYAHHNIDTLLIAGGPGVKAASEDSKILRYLQTMVTKVRRIGSICGGALILANAGILDGKKATTHWNDIKGLVETHPTVDVKSGITYVRDGHIYTSGGVMNGVQLALALLEEDYGIDLTLKVAKLMEVTYKQQS